MDPARRAIESVFREEYGRIVATLIRRCRDFELAEEALQDALTIALERWPEQGTPDNPAAWITQTARRRLIDRLRRRQREEVKAVDDFDGDAAQEDDPGSLGNDFPHADDRLRLIFTCCHPALAHEAQVALTLNTLCGLQTPEIASAFLTSERTMAQRLVRAKRKIREANIPYRVPAAPLLAERLPAVLSVVYLVFNEGYSASRGDVLMRRELCGEAIRLGRILVELMGDEPELFGLLALMLLQDSRRSTRMTENGDLLLLEDQNRSLWDRESIADGLALLQRAMRLGRPGSYQLQAAIAALHAEASRPEDTDWEQIVLLYGELLQHHPSPVIELNRAVALAMARGPELGLQAVDTLARSGRLDGYLYLYATRADLLRRLGRDQAAREQYRHALKLAKNASEQRYLADRLRALEP